MRSDSSDRSAEAAESSHSEAVQRLFVLCGFPERPSVLFSLRRLNDTSQLVKCGRNLTDSTVKEAIAKAEAGGNAAELDPSLNRLSSLGLRIRYSERSMQLSEPPTDEPLKPVRIRVALSLQKLIDEILLQCGRDLWSGRGNWC
jgi:hypothetical protein